MFASLDILNFNWKKWRWELSLQNKNRINDSISTYNVIKSSCHFYEIASNYPICSVRVGLKIKIIFFIQNLHFTSQVFTPSVSQLLSI